MSLKERLAKKKADLQAQYQRGIEVTEQMKAEKLRKRKEKLGNLKPGAISSIRVGLAARSGPLDVMKGEYSRRKYERKKK